MTLAMLVAVLASLTAAGLGILAWTQHREASRRSAARVAALAAAIDDLETLDTESASPSRPATSLGASHRWMMAAGLVPAGLVVVALLVTRAPTATAPVAQRQPQSLELLSMHHARSGDALTVIGLVRVHGADSAPVTAVVTGRDGDGRVVATAHAPIDDTGLDRDGESSFQVEVPGGRDVNRYQVRFETPLGPLTHIDRRRDRTTSPVTP